MVILKMRNAQNFPSYWVTVQIVNMCAKYFSRAILSCKIKHLLYSQIKFSLKCNDTSSFGNIKIISSRTITRLSLQSAKKKKRAGRRLRAGNIYSARNILREENRDWFLSGLLFFPLSFGATTFPALSRVSILRVYAIAYYSVIAFQDC